MDDITQADWALALKQRGIQIKKLTPDEAKARHEEEARHFTDIWKQQQLTRYYKNSLWGDQQQMNFVFKNWEPKKQKDVERSKEVARHVKELATQLENDAFNVYFFGHAGTGKTALAIAMLNQLRKMQTGMFVSVIEWATLEYQSFNDEQAQNRLYSMKNLMMTADVLILDDFGKETQRDAKETVAKMLYKLSNERRGKSTIITSNDSPMDLAKKYDEATISRLIPKDPTHVISMKGLSDVRRA